MESPFFFFPKGKTFLGVGILKDERVFTGTHTAVAAGFLGRTGQFAISQISG